MADNYVTATAPTLPSTTDQDKWWVKPGTTDTSAGVMGQAATYTPGATTQTDATKWTPDANQLVTGQVDQIISADSPLMQRAGVRADQQMNKRGLMNSSMAVGAGQAAVMDAALPMAQQNAQTYANAGQFNATQAGQFELANTEAANRAKEFEAAGTNALQQQSNTIRQQTAQFDAQEANKGALAQLDVNFKTAISNADAGSKALLQQMSDTTKVDLANIQAAYQQMISSNEQAGALFGRVTQNITDIVNNPDMAAADKTIAIDNQKQLLKAGMDVVSAVSGLGLGDILTF